MGDALIELRSAVTFSVSRSSLCEPFNYVGGKERQLISSLWYPETHQGGLGKFYPMCTLTPQLRAFVEPSVSLKTKQNTHAICLFSRVGS